MDAKNLRVGMIATTLLALGTLASPAFADGRQDSRSQWRQDTREIHQDRRELRRDYRELAEDRADYRHAQSHGNIFAMFRKRMEIHRDKQEIRRDQAELRHDLHERRQEVRGHQNRNHHWNEQRGVRHDFRQDAAQGHQAQAVNRQGARQQAERATVSPQPSAAQQNNGRHLGWQQGRGNPHRG